MKVYLYDMKKFNELYCNSTMQYRQRHHVVVVHNILFMNKKAIECLCLLCLLS